MFAQVIATWGPNCDKKNVVCWLFLQKGLVGVSLSGVTAVSLSGVSAVSLSGVSAVSLSGASAVSCSGVSALFFFSGLSAAMLLCGVAAHVSHIFSFTYITPRNIMCSSAFCAYFLDVYFCFV